MNRLAFPFEEIYLLEARVVIYEYHEVSKTVRRSGEWSGYVRVDEPPWVRGLIDVGRVWHASGVRLLAVLAGTRRPLLDVRRDVCSKRAKTTQGVQPDVHAPAEEFEGLVGW